MARFQRFICVVSQNRPDLYEMLRAEFAWQSDVVIVLDRRRGEHAGSPEGSPVDLRQAERRAQPELDAELETVGYFMSCCGRAALAEVV